MMVWARTLAMQRSVIVVDEGAGREVANNGEGEVVCQRSVRRRRSGSKQRGQLVVECGQINNAGRWQTSDGDRSMICGDVAIGERGKVGGW